MRFESYFSRCISVLKLWLLVFCVTLNMTHNDPVMKYQKYSYSIQTKLKPAVIPEHHNIQYPISIITFTFTFNHLADAFIQSDVQMRTIEAIRPSREQQYTSAMTSLS